MSSSSSSDSSQRQRRKRDRKVHAWDRYHYIILDAHNDGRLTLLRRQRAGRRNDLGKVHHDPSQFRKEENRSLSLLPTWQMCAPIARYLKKALEDVPKGERKAAVRLALFRLGAQEYGCDCFVKHGLVYWHLRDLDRRVIAWQIQSGSYDRERARILLDNRAIYRNVIDIREDNTVRIIALKRRRFS